MAGGRQRGHQRKTIEKDKEKEEVKFYSFKHTKTVTFTGGKAFQKVKPVRGRFLPELNLMKTIEKNIYLYILFICVLQILIIKVY